MSDDPGIPSIVLADSESLFHAIHKNALAADLVESADLKRHFLNLVVQLAQAGVDHEQMLKETQACANVEPLQARIVAGKTFLAQQRAQSEAGADHQAWASEVVAQWQTLAFEE